MAFKVHSIDAGENIADDFAVRTAPGEINYAVRENRVHEGVMLQTITAKQLIDPKNGFDGRVTYETATGWFNEPHKVSAIGSYGRPSDPSAGKECHGLRGELIKPAGQEGVNISVEGTGEIIDGKTELSLFAGTQFHSDATIEFSADTHADIEQMLDAIAGPNLAGVWVRVMTDDGVTADRSVPGCGKADGEYPAFSSLPSLQVKFTPEALRGARVHEGYYIRRREEGSDRTGLDANDGVFYGGKTSQGFAHLHTTIAGLSRNNIAAHNRLIRSMNTALPESGAPFLPSIGGHTLDLAPVRYARAQIMFLDQAFVMESSENGRTVFRPMNENPSTPSDAEINHGNAAFNLELY